MFADMSIKTGSRKVLTLVFLRDATRVLLGMKKRGFGVGKWNGFGGKVEPGETVVEAAAREVREECGYCVKTEDLGCKHYFMMEMEYNQSLLVKMRWG